MSYFASPTKSSPNSPQSGTPTKVTVAEIFPTTSPLKQYEHRAGVLDYPSPTKTDASPVLSPSAQRDLKSQREGTQRSGSIEQTRGKWISPVRQNSSDNEPSFYRCSRSSGDGNQSPKMQNQPKFTQDRRSTEDLEGRLASLTRVTRKLVGAVSKSQRILKACIDDPETQEVIDY
jgi:hypothetical protein